METGKPRPKRRRKIWRWLLVLVLLLGAGLVWLNGPGLRYIGPRVVAHFLEKAGIRGGLKIGGSLTGGLSFSDLTIETDGALAKLTIGKVVPEYELRGLVKGQLKGLTVDGVHTDLRLGMESKEEEKPPLDLKKLVETIRSVRGQVLPLRLDLKNISLAATRDGKTELLLDTSSLSHAAGSNDIVLELGKFTDPTGREWEGRQSTIVWNPDDLAIARLDPFPAVSVRDFVMQLPEGGEPSVEAQVHLDDAVFMLTSSPGFSSAQIDLREGQLQVDEAVKHFGIELPAKATVISLAVEANSLMPDPLAATGSVRLSLDNVAWQDWKAAEVTLDAQLSGDGANVASHAVALGTAISLEATAPVTRVKAGDKTNFVLGDATGKFNVADVPALLKDLSGRVPAIDPTVPVPPSSVDGNFLVAFEANKPKSADAALVVQPKDVKVASPLGVKGHWAPQAPVVAEVTVDGLKAAATYQIEPATYQGTLALDEFSSSRIEPWLAIVKVKPGGTAALSGKWSGAGDVKAGRHRGEVMFTQATWSREAASPITAIGGVKYDWPAGFDTQGLRVQMDNQSVALEAGLGNGLLELRNFLWKDGEQELAEGTASLPVPEDFAKWKDTLANDTRAVDVSINSRVLSLGLLKQWVPAMEQLDPKSTGQVEIKVTGTYANPIVDATVQARDLRAPAQPKLPPADLKIVIAARDGRIAINGEATAPDFPPAVMKAAMPFRPSDWAQTPESIKEETVEARVDLPRLDLSRFASLVPAAQKVAGVLTGNVVVTGKVGKPEIRGALDLTGGGVVMKDGNVPPVEGVAASVDLAMDKVVLKTLKATVAGGSLNGDGSVVITEGKLGELRLQVRGDHLPIVRNDSLILRANANLTLQGTLEKSTLSGTVGAVDSIFFRDIEILPIGQPFTGPSAASLPKIDPPKTQGAAVPEPFRNWGLDLTVRTEDPVIIRGNLANGEVSGSIRVGGTVGSPAPDGAFIVKDLTASLPFSTLTIRRGTLTFAPSSGFDPILEIRGTAEPRPYQVTVYAYGRASDPQLVLTSNPPLPENEIMTLLATGTTTSGLEDPSTASSRTLQLLAEEMRRGRFRFGKQLRPLLALLDKVDFSLSDSDPYSNDTFSSATVQLTDRYFLSAGIGGTGDSRGMLIWRLRFR